MKVINLSHLQTLDLSHNQINCLHERNSKGEAFSFLREMPRLKTLNLSNNSISNLHSSVFISCSDSLKKIDISSNKLQKGLLAFACLSSLEILDLSSNLLEDTQEFRKLDGKLRKLCLLNLSHNEFEVKYGNRCPELINKFFKDTTIIVYNLKANNESRGNQKTKPKTPLILKEFQTVLKPNNNFESTQQHLNSQISMNSNKIVTSLFKGEHPSTPSVSGTSLLSSYSQSKSNPQFESRDKRSSSIEFESRQCVSSRLSFNNNSQRDKSPNKSKDNQQITIQNKHKRVNSAYSVMEAIEEKPKSMRVPLSTVTEQSDTLHLTKSTKSTKELLKSDNNSNLSNLQISPIYQTPTRNHQRAPSAPIEARLKPYNKPVLGGISNRDIENSPLGVVSQGTSLILNNNNYSAMSDRQQSDASYMKDITNYRSEDNFSASPLLANSNYPTKELQSAAVEDNNNDQCDQFQLNNQQSSLQEYYERMQFSSSLCQLLLQCVFNGDQRFEMDKLYETFLKNKEGFSNYLQQSFLERRAADLSQSIQNISFKSLFDPRTIDTLP